MTQQWQARRGWIAVVTAAIATGMCVVLVRAAPSTEEPPDAAPPVGPTPTGSPEPARATVHSSQSEGCSAILAADPERVSDETAEADTEWMSEKFFGDHPSDNSFRLLVRSSCGDLPVVVIGVKNSSVEVPSYGPGGTPVIAYRQPKIVAF